MKGLESIDQAVVQELKEKIALGCKILAKLELSDYLGHVSARIPETDLVLIKARGLDMGNLLDMTADKVVIVDLEGRKVEGEGLNPPDEVVLHTEIFKARPDVMSVVHTHQPISTVLCDLGMRILPMQGVMAAIAAREIPVFESSLKIVTHEQGAGVAQALGDHVAVHLRNHGVCTVGDSIEQAVVFAIWMEYQAKLTWQASMAGTPRGMSQEEAELQIKDALGPMASRWRYYCSLLDTK
ncbi:MULTISPECIES: class II aldolase/adducin family protein [unclassified Paenibacillus]|uniref:class II aldolase/adducin family protein n=1 Tax=unclassified Paenibacillus TaxID=185978 RepID=UPI001AE453A9|nr:MULTISPECIES: class II aldolase/adducin family protein [unclassified Paenibacillus]MBP1156891.1 L-ribulose-5-phosphate 4-epimerase [Paenibacillus sp. PvP091]MBP1172370.1 L-ribulose-5-phosphate 4-epimerase [Paenibacillus sp. PvR098]MBP2438751.1 L-ribulose-5-phosphate 4-epimerase [Paenibacillus sp. PvP052]